MFMNLIAGCLDAGCEIVGVLRYDKVRYPLLDRLIIDIFNPSTEYNYIKAHKLYEIKAKSVNSAEFKKEILKLNADVVLVGTWGEKFKKSIIDLPKFATINVHPSLLPKYRGPNPYLQAIKHLETQSGVTFHLMDEKYDTGSILLQKTVEINSKDTGTELREKIALLSRGGACELMQTLDTEIIIPIAQDEKHASYFPQIEEEEVMLDFSKSAEEVSAHIRAFSPWFKCYFGYNRQFFTPNPYKLEILSELQKEKLGVKSKKQKAKSDKDTIYHLPFTICLKTIVDKSEKDNSITVLCGDGKLLKLSDLKLYGFFKRFFTTFYIKHRVKTVNGEQ